MSRQIDVGATDELAEGTMKAVTSEGLELLVARVGDDFYAVEERCPHMGGHLSRGALEGTVVRCPVHGSRFDLSDGSVLRWTEFSGLALKLGKLVKPSRPLKTYPVLVLDGRLLVEIG